jgi:hypothetical protein
VSVGPEASTGTCPDAGSCACHDPGPDAGNRDGTGASGVTYDAATSSLARLYRVQTTPSAAATSCGQACTETVGEAAASNSEAPGSR